MLRKRSGTHGANNAANCGPGVWVLGLALVFLGCQNFSLADKLENPGGSGFIEKFTDRFYAFVSSWQTQGDMSFQPYSDCNALTGVEKADCACTRAAAANGLRKHSQHEFRAFLGLPGAPVYNPPCRSVGYPAGCATSIPSPWYNTMDAVIFTTHNPTAFSTALQNPIKFTENRVDIVSGTVWTGATAAGAHSNMCPTNWTVADATLVNVGDLSSPTTTWEFSTTAACNTPARVYCFATSPP